MTNCDFKNALVGQKCSLDRSWPCLNETNNVIKRASKKNLVSTSHCLVSHEIVPFPTGNDLFSTTHSKEIQIPFANDDFPELSCSSLSRKHNGNPKNDSVVANSLNPASKAGFRFSKNSKLKKGLINIPLLSLVKVHINKKKITHKKTCHVKRLPRTYCGNKLDSDNPLRRKGKVRLHRKKFESRLRKEIILSRHIKKENIAFDEHVLRVKALLPTIFNCNRDQAINKLGSLLGSLNLEENENNVCESVPVVSECEACISIDPSTQKFAKKILHSNNYRDYCTNIVTKSLVEIAESFVTTLRKFQDRQHAKDPGKAFAKRRYLCGFKETKKFLLADRVKIIIIATNLELETDLPSGRILEEITSICKEKNIPVIFVGRGNQIGYWTLKRRRISIISILNYDGAEEAQRKLIDTWTECKEMYKIALQEIEHRLPGGREEKVVDKTVEDEIRENVLSKLSANGNKLIK